MLLIVAAIVVGGMIGAVWLSGEQRAGAGGPLAAGGAENPIIVSDKCQTDGTNSLGLAALNPVNATLTYLAPTAMIENTDGVVIDSGALTGGGTLTYATLNVICSDKNYKGTIKTLATTVFTSGEGAFDFDMNKGDTVVINAGMGTTLKIGAFLTTTGTNTTNATTDTNFAASPDCDGSNCGCNLNEGTSYVAGTTVGSGGTFSRYIDYVANESSKQFGSIVAGQKGILIGVDNNNSAAFRDDDIKFSVVAGGCTLEEVSCADARIEQSASSHELDKCYLSEGRTANDVVCRIRLDGTATSGNPANDVRIWFSDLGYVQDTDGYVKYLAMTSGGTDVGVADCSLTVNLG